MKYAQGVRVMALDPRKKGEVMAVFDGSGSGYEVETRYMSVAQAAKVLGLSRMTMYRKIHAGQVRANRVGRKLRVFVPDIEKMSAPAYLTAQELD